MHLTPSQSRALAAASVAPLRYYRGGWYGNDAAPDAASPPTLRALTLRGLLIEWHTSDAGLLIYRARWSITDEGRALVEGVLT